MQVVLATRFLATDSSLRAPQRLGECTGSLAGWWTDGNSTLCHLVASTVARWSSWLSSGLTERDKAGLPAKWTRAQQRFRGDILQARTESTPLTEVCTEGMQPVTR